MTEQWLVVVGAGRWQLSGIEAARTEGIRVLALDADAKAPGFAIADRAEVVDIRNPNAVLACVGKTGIRPSGAVAFVTDAGMMSAAAIREQYELAGPRPILARRLIDKHEQRALWTQAGLPCPRWSCVNSEEQAEQAVTALAGTVIFKPTDSAGSRGVTVVDAGQDWQPAFRRAMAASTAGAVMIEAFVVGVEFAVETFADGGKTTVLAVTEKKKVAGTRDTVAVQLATPSRPDAVVDEIGSLAVKALVVLGYEAGPGHTEILRSADGAFWLVETAGRGGGFMVADGIVPKASGFDLVRACALQAVGRAATTQPEIRGDAVVLRFLPSRPGVVVAISGFEEARALGNIDCDPLVAIGSRVADANTDGGRLAYILSWAHDVATALSLADRAEAFLNVEISTVPC